MSSHSQVTPEDRAEYIRIEEIDAVDPEEQSQSPKLPLRNRIGPPPAYTDIFAIPQPLLDSIRGLEINLRLVRYRFNAVTEERDQARMAILEAQRQIFRLRAEMRELQAERDELRAREREAAGQNMLLRRQLLGLRRWLAERMGLED